MSRQRDQLAEQIFLELSAVEPEQREPFLLTRTQGDDELAAKVRELLRGLESGSNGFLDPAEVQRLAKRAQLGEERPLAPGVTVGDYTLMGVLGQGGMGVVYMARQERPRRTVALKMLRGSLFGSSALRRFEHEAEVLGMLQHPGIAQIFEAGTADLGTGAQPFIAMELVDGPNIARYVRDHDLPIAHRVELMAQVCDAVHHAHQRGVIHRDLKPGNILVDTSGRPKVLDFGVSRAADADPLAASMHTRTGQLIGTLAYMSPEQAVGSADQIDVRTDVYALGAVLFELLSGQLPFDVRTKPIPEAARIIHDTEPRHLSQFDARFRGDLDVITRRALEKDKSRRYQSAADLGDDLRRFLSGAPISAKQDSVLYVLRKQVRRHKLVASLIAAIALVVVSFGVVSTLLAVRSSSNAETAQLERWRAESALATVTLERARADQAAARAIAELRSSQIEQGRLLGQSGSMTLAEDLIWPELIRDPDSEHAFWALAELYASAPCRATVRAHEGSVRGLVFRHGGSRLLSVGEDGWLREWDVATNGLVRAAAVSGAAAVSLSLSADQARIAVLDTRGWLRVLDAGDWSCITEFRAVPGAGLSVVFDPTGRRLAASGNAGVICCYDATDFRELWSASPARSFLHTLAYSPNGERLVVSGSDSEARVYSAASGKELAVLHGTFRSAGADWSPDGRLIVTGGSDLHARLFDAGTYAQLAAFNDYNGTLNSCRFSADSRRLFLGGWWRTDVIDLDRWELAATFTGHRRGAPALAVDPSGLSIATGSTDSDLRLWDLPECAPLRRVATPHTNRVVGVWFSPDQSRALSVSFDRRVVLWDTASWRPVRVLDRAGGAYACSAVFIGNGERFAHIRQDRSVEIRWSDTGTLACSLGRLPDVVTAIGSTPDGQFVFVADVRDALSTFDASAAQLIRTDPLRGDDPLRISVAPDGSRLDVLQRGIGMESWRLPSMEPLAPLYTTIPKWCFDTTPDGRFVIMGNWDRNAELWDTRTRELVETLGGHRQIVSNVSIARDGTHMLSSSTDGTAKWWDIPNARCLLTLAAPNLQPFYSSTLAPDGRTILCGGLDGGLYLWDLGAFDRYVAGNLEHRLRHAVSEHTPDPESVARLRAWATRVLDPSIEPAPIGGPGSFIPPR